MRYVVVPKAWFSYDDDQPVSVPSMQIEPSTARPTGLLNAKGEQIWAEPDPIGFRFNDNEPS